MPEAGGVAQIEQAPTVRRHLLEAAGEGLDPAVASVRRVGTGEGGLDRDQRFLGQGGQGAAPALPRVQDLVPGDAARPGEEGALGIVVVEALPQREADLLVDILGLVPVPHQGEDVGLQPFPVAAEQGDETALAVIIGRGHALIPGSPGSPRSDRNSAHGQAMPVDMFRKGFKRCAASIRPPSTHGLLRQDGGMEPPPPPTPGTAPTLSLAESEALVSALWTTRLTPGGDPQATIRSTPRQSGTTVTIRPHLLTAPGAAGADADYELLEIIGQGGMGVVYQARQTAIDRPIALKMLHRESAGDGQARAGFLAEAVVTGGLEHPNIVPVHDLGSDAAGNLFFSMKRVEGRTWREALRAGQPIAEAVEVLERVCDAVAFAHSRGILHRDLKPGNVMLGGFGEVLVMDWGLAIAFGPAGRGIGAERADPLAGTPAYMAPEMARGERERLSPRSDVYLLGACLWEALTGSPPHRGDGQLASLLLAAANRIGPAPGPEGELHRLARQAMAERPEDRPADVPAFRAGLRSWRTHAASLALAEAARAELASADNHERFATARHGFAEALRLWPEHAEAGVGLARAAGAQAEFALGRGDLDLAASLLATPGVDPGLGRRVAAAQAQRAARGRQLRLAKQAAAALALCLVVGGTLAFLAVRASRDQAQAELQRRIALEAERDAARIAVLQRVAALEARGGASASAAAAVVGDARAALLLAAQSAYRQALFLAPEQAGPVDGLRQALLAHQALAEERGDWRQAREKLDQAREVGLGDSAWQEAAARIEAAATARQRLITGRVAALMEDAARSAPIVPPELARSELISLADPLTVDLLLQRLADPVPSCRLLALDALGWMRDQRAVPALITQLGQGRSEAELAAAIIALCALRPPGRIAYDAICARLERERIAGGGPLQQRVLPAWRGYAATVVDAAALEDEAIVTPIAPLRHAYTYLELGRWDEADAWFLRSLRVLFNLAPFRGRIEAHRGRGDPAGALALFDGMDEARARHPELLLLRAILLIDLDRLDEAGAVLDAALAQEPNALSALSARARLLARRDAPEALQAWDAVLAQAADDPGLRLERGRLRLRRGDLGGALVDARRAAALDPGSPAGPLLAAEVRAALGDPAAAVAELEEARRRGAKERGLVGLLAAWRWEAGARDAALAEAQQARELDAGDPGAGVVEARRLLAAGSATGARIAWQAVLAVEPLRAAWRSEYALVLLRCGATAAAAQEAERAQTEQPWSALIAGRRALLLLDLGRQDEALALAEAAVGLGLQDPRPLTILGWVRERSGRSSDALAAYAQAMACPQADPQPVVNRLHLAARLGRWAEAAAAGDRLAELAVPAPADLAQRGLARLALRRPGALADLRAACGVPTAAPEIRAALIIALEEAGAAGEAAEVRARLRGSGADPTELEAALRRRLAMTGP